MPIMTFRKKPVTIQAMQWKGNNIHECLAFCPKARRASGTSEETLIIDTLEGAMICSTGDWIIKGVAGEFYPCKPDIFQKTYDFVLSDKP